MLSGLIKRSEQRRSELLDLISVDEARMDACKELLHRLPLRDALALRLHYCQGLSDALIARQLDMSERHVVRIRRYYMERRAAADVETEDQDDTPPPADR